MPNIVLPALLRVRRLLTVPADALTQLSDDADAIWEPFLDDGSAEPLRVAA